MILKIPWHAVIKAAARIDTEVVSETTKGGGLRGKLNKVVLAYSGGLDTSVIVPWLRYRCCRPPFFPFFYQTSTVSLEYWILKSERKISGTLGLFGREERNRVNENNKDEWK